MNSLRLNSMHKILILFVLFCFLFVAGVIAGPDDWIIRHESKVGLLLSTRNQSDCKLMAYDGPFTNHTPITHQGSNVVVNLDMGDTEYDCTDVTRFMLRSKTGNGNRISDYNIVAHLNNGSQLNCVWLLDETGFNSHKLALAPNAGETTVENEHPAQAPVQVRQALQRPQRRSMVNPMAADSIPESVEIEWVEFTGVEDFLSYCRQQTQRIYDMYIQYQPPTQLPWSTIDSTLWGAADNLKNDTQMKFQNLLKKRNRVDRHKSSMEMYLATYVGLTKSLKTLEESEKALKETYLQSLREIDVTVVVANYLDYPSVQSPLVAENRIVKEIEEFVKDNADIYVGTWIESEMELPNHQLTKDITILTSGLRMEPYPSDPIIDNKIIQRDTYNRALKKRKTIIKAMRIFPNLLLDNERLYKQEAPSLRSSCPNCLILNSQTNNISEFSFTSTDNEDKFRMLLHDVKNHDGIRESNFESLAEDYSSQMDDIYAEIQHLSEQKATIEYETNKIMSNYPEKNQVDLKSDVDDIEAFYTEVIGFLGNKKDDYEKKLNAVYESMDKIVYSTKRHPVKRSEDITNSSMNLFISGTPDSLFDELIRRLRELRKIGVTTVSNHELKSISGTEYYIEPDASSIKEFALFGPSFPVEDSQHDELRYAIFTLALRAKLERATCPRGQGEIGEFLELLTYNQAADLCAQCSLPSVAELRTMTNLPEGEYWTSDKDGLMVRMFIKGVSLCDDLEGDPFFSNQFQSLGRGMGVINRMPSNAAKALCQDSVP